MIDINTNILKFAIKSILLISLFLITNSVAAENYFINSRSDIVGSLQEAKVKPGDSIYKIARRFDVGTHEMKEANANVNPNKLIAGEYLLVPSKFILPTTREGIVLNLAELRVYYFHKDSNKVSTFPVGIGRLGWRTPVGETIITRKRENPTWRPPESIRKAALRKGKVLPEIMPAGPNNPLGDYAMNLGWPRYLMHGTNQPETVGLRSSSGCIRMYPEDIEQLYSMVDLNTKVHVIHEPYKLGKSNGKLYLEAHDPLVEKYYGYQNVSKGSILNDIAKEASEKYRYYSIDKDIIQVELKRTYGYPIRLD